MGPGCGPGPGGNGTTQESDLVRRVMEERESGRSVGAIVFGVERPKATGLRRWCLEVARRMGWRRLRGGPVRWAERFEPSM